MSNIEDYGYTDYKIMNENYCDYKLADGTIIRTRAILFKVIKEDDDITMNEKAFATSFSPQALKGPASSERLPEGDITKIKEAIKTPDVEIILTKERWSDYELSNGEKLSIKAVLVSASLTDKYDERGDPVYAVQLQTLHKLTPNKGKLPQEKID